MLKRAVDWITSKPINAATVVLGLVLATLSLAPISNALFPSNPRLEIVVLNEVNVFEINRPIPDLRVIFRGDDIRSTDSNLRIMTLRLQNVGRSDILQAYYDQDRDWGIEVTGGQVIDARVVESNSDYLLSSVLPSITSISFVKLNKVIFESGKYFTIDVVVLHERSSSLQILHPSRIANTGDVIIVTKAEAEGSLIYLLRRGYLTDYLILGTYGLLGGAIVVGVIAFLLLIVVLVRFFIHRHRRSRMVSIWLNEGSIKDTVEARYLLKQYVNSDPARFQQFLQFISSDHGLIMSDVTAKDPFWAIWSPTLLDMHKKGMIRSDDRGGWFLSENTTKAIEELRPIVHEASNTRHERETLSSHS